MSEIDEKELDFGGGMRDYTPEEVNENIKLLGAKEGQTAKELPLPLLEQYLESQRPIGETRTLLKNAPFADERYLEAKGQKVPVTDYPDLVGMLPEEIIENHYSKQVTQTQSTQNKLAFSNLPVVSFTRAFDGGSRAGLVEAYMNNGDCYLRVREGSRVFDIYTDELGAVFPVFARTFQDILTIVAWSETLNGKICVINVDLTNGGTSGQFRDFNYNVGNGWYVTGNRDTLVCLEYQFAYNEINNGDPSVLSIGHSDNVSIVNIGGESLLAIDYSRWIFSDHHNSFFDFATRMYSPNPYRYCTYNAPYFDESYQEILVHQIDEVSRFSMSGQYLGAFEEPAAFQDSDCNVIYDCYIENKEYVIGTNRILANRMAACGLFINTNKNADVNDATYRSLAVLNTLFFTAVPQLNLVTFSNGKKKVTGVIGYDGEVNVITIPELPLPTLYINDIYLDDFAWSENSAFGAICPSTSIGADPFNTEFDSLYYTKGSHSILVPNLSTSSTKTFIKSK